MIVLVLLSTITEYDSLSSLFTNEGVQRANPSLKILPEVGGYKGLKKSFQMTSELS